MGQKIHPYGFRLGVTKDWKAKWYAEKGFGELFVEDRKIRDFITKNLSHAGISNIIIERAANKVKLVIFTGRPGLVIGRKGQGAEQLKKDKDSLEQKINQFESAERRDYVTAEDLRLNWERMKREFLEGDEKKKEEILRQTIQKVQVFHEYVKILPK